MLLQRLTRLRAASAAPALCRRWSSASPPPAAPAAPAAVDKRLRRAAATARWNVHHEVVTCQRGLPEVFARLQVEKQLRGGDRSNPAPLRQAVDTFYFHCAQQQRALDVAFQREVLRYFHTELFRADTADVRFALGETLNEAAFGAVIKLHLGAGDARAAWVLVDRLHALADDTKLHFRTLGPILEHECRAGNFLGAYARWQQLKRDGGVSWTDAMEDALVHMVVACCAAHHERRETSHEQFHEQMVELLGDLRTACKEVSGASAQRLRQAFRSAGYAAKTVQSDHAMCPTCAACGLALEKLGVSAAERAQLLLAIESRETKAAKGGATAQELLAPFKTWLLNKHAQTAAGKLHFVLDGPNIAYINQNFDAGSCRLDHIDAVASMLLADGHNVSITMPFSYLADRIVLRIRTKKTKQQQRQGKFTTRQRTAAEKALIDKWQTQGLLFSCRTDCISDDLFWLYASVLLGKEGRVVTNDQGRDHVFALLTSDVSKAAASHGRKTTKASPAASNGSIAGDAASTAPLPPPPPPEISMDLIDRWKELSIVNIEIQHQEVHPDAPLAADEKIPIEEIRLLHPLPFSRVPQATAPGHFHFPVTSDAPPSSNNNNNSNSSNGGGSGTSAAANARSQRKKWLCVHRKAESESESESESQP